MPNEMPPSRAEAKRNYIRKKLTTRSNNVLTSQVVRRLSVSLSFKNSLLGNVMKKTRFAATLYTTGLIWLCVGAGMICSSSVTATTSVSVSKASSIVGGASDGYFRASNSGCGAYSKVGAGGVTLRCAFQDTAVGSNRLLGIWGSPGLTQNCTQCGVTCGSVQFIGQPKES